MFIRSINKENDIHQQKPTICKMGYISPPWKKRE